MTPPGETKKKRKRKRTLRDTDMDAREVTFKHFGVNRVLRDHDELASEKDSDEEFVFNIGELLGANFDVREVIMGSRGCRRGGVSTAPEPMRGATGLWMPLQRLLHQQHIRDGGLLLGVLRCRPALRGRGLRV